MRETGQGRTARNRGNEYDRAAGVIHEMIRRRAGHLPRPDQVVANHRLETLVRDVAGRGNILTTRIVHQNVKLSVVLLDPPHRGFDTGLIAGVAGHDKRLAPAVRIISAVSSSGSSRRANRASLAPQDAISSAVARPMPDPEPVTRAT